MKKMRMLGYNIKELSQKHHLSIDELGECLNLSTTEINEVYKGRKFLSYDLIEKLAHKMELEPSEILDTSSIENEYGKNVVHCMTDFTNSDNREMMLDIIEHYMDIYEAVNK